MKWKLKPGLWMCDPFTIELQLDERTKLVVFELYDGTRYVKAFNSVQEAKQHARGMQYLSDERCTT